MLAVIDVSCARRFTREEKETDEQNTVFLIKDALRLQQQMYCTKFSFAPVYVHHLSVVTLSSPRSPHPFLSLLSYLSLIHILLTLLLIGLNVRAELN